MCIQTESKGRPPPLAIVGAFTIYTVAQCRARLLERLASCAALELDLSAVSEIDTAGQQLLLAAHLHARARGGSMRVLACSAVVTDLLTLCGLAARFGAPQRDGGQASLVAGRT